MGKRRYYSRKKYYGRGRGNPVGLLVLLAIGFVLNNLQLILIIGLVAGVVWTGWTLYHRGKDENQGDSQDQTAFTGTQAAPETQRPSESKTEYGFAENTSQGGPAQEKHRPVYSSKGSIMTECERAFFLAIREVAEPQYIVQPQVNLASVIDKESHSRYRNELFRNVDFGIFDKDYRLIVLVEINDQSHMMYTRQERDQKVKQICEEAGIPLVTLWTKYGVNKAYIRNRLAEHLKLDQNQWV